MYLPCVSGRGEIPFVATAQRGFAPVSYTHTHTTHHIPQLTTKADRWCLASHGWGEISKSIYSNLYADTMMYRLEGGDRGVRGDFSKEPGISQSHLNYFLKVGVPSKQIGYLKNFYSVCRFVSRRFTFATQAFAQYRIPLYSRIIARFVFLPHSEQTWFVSGVKPT